MTQKISRDDIALYVMGAYDGDVAALEARIAEDAAARDMLAEEAALELSLRDAAAAGTFCPSCDDLVADTSEPVRCISCGAAVHPGGYRIERVLVANAHGRMYVARDADGTRVALKELAFVQSPSAETVGAFEREAKFLRALEHPAIPQFKAAFEEGTGVHTRYYLAQELVEGTALDTRLDDHFYSEKEIVDIARQVLGVLVYLQGLSPMVIHRDIKPANLITRPDGSIAVVDFGAAHVQGTTAGSTSIGTFGYMPLEQLAGQVDATTDTYALGASLIHLLTRREPWRVFGPATFESINVSPALQQFLAKCVAPEREHRFANAAAALAALDAPANVVALAPRTSRIPHRAWKVAAGILAAALAFGGAGIAGYMLRGEPAAAPAPDDGDEADLDEDPSHEHARDIHEKIARLRARTDLLREKAEALRAAGVSRVKVEDLLRLHGDEPEYIATPPPLPPRFENDSLVSLSFKNAQLEDVLRTISGSCGINIVLPDSLRATITLDVGAVPCRSLLDTVLEMHGLDYEYTPGANVARIAPRKELVHEREEAQERAPIRERLGRTDALPAGPTVDFDFKDAPLHDLAKMIGTMAKVNIAIPNHIQTRVTVILKGVPWDVAFKEILAANGLWFRYRDDGKIIRVAPRKELDHEDREAVERL